MALQARNQRQSAHDEESFFVSMTDMMVGMLFLFIIMLMFFAMKFNEAAVKKIEVVENLTNAEETRGKILQDIKKALDAEGVTVVIDLDNGILRLPEEILFDRGKSALSVRGQNAVVSLSKALFRVLPCYTDSATPACGKIRHQVESVFVEGHTDTDGEDNLNWNLSFQRSLSTFEFLQKASPALVALKNRDGQIIISLSGYGKQRPLNANSTPEEKAQNRRIDIRFIMSPPKAIELRGEGTAAQRESGT
ncbi:MAG: OmpA family protein [Magnetococcales bacterium]|nr:OmpA family protein [Magnetococcales bacterium]